MKMPTTYSAAKTRNFAMKHFGLTAMKSYSSNPYSDVQRLSGHMTPENVEKYKAALIDAGFVCETRHWSNVPFYVHADGAVILVGTDRKNTGKHIIDFHGAKKAKPVSNFSVYD